MTDTLKRSVTRDDYQSIGAGGVYRMIMPFGPGDYGLLPKALPMDLPEWWSRGRDQVLRTSVHHEGMWASAVAIAATKIAALGWEIDGDVPLRVSRGRDILAAADHRQGWVSFISKLVRDYLTTDNGAFVEIVRASSARGSRIIGLEPLDSWRCIRTSDPAVPVLFHDKAGAEHELRDYQVLSFADMPDTGLTWNGVGLCAASRAWTFIVKLAAMERYLIEKVTGRRALSVHFITGLADATIKSALVAGQADAAAKGAYHYMGAILAGVLGDTPVSGYEVDLAGMPDGFNRKEEWDIALLAYANAIGLDSQDLQPLTGQALGTGAQSRVLDNKAKGRGLAAFRQALTHGLNEWVLAAGTTFAFTERDYSDQAQEAAISKARMDVMGAAIDKQIVTPEQAAQILVDQDELPADILPEGDQTADLNVSDADGKAAEEDAIQQPVTPTIAGAAA